MRHPKPLLSFLAAAVLFGFGLLSIVHVGCSRRDDADGLAKIKNRGKVIVGVFGDKPPFGYIDRQGRNTGYDVALARRIAGDLLGDENKIEFVALEAANRVAFLQSNKVDIILANFTRTPERAEKVDFAKPYMKVALGIVVPEASPLDALDGLKNGKTLIVNKGTTAEAWFTKNHPGIKLLKFDQNTEAFQALKDGRGDALAHDNTLLFAWAHENKGFKVIESNLGNADVIAPAVKKGDTVLRAWIDAEIEKLAAEHFFLNAFHTELRPFFGDSVKNPDDVIIEGK
ncbi:cysteine ABC transporter substrate-binding protein [Termitidicoccus mucosus]|uniref:ABC transporter substrate-binding protein n=1 Tax=Termitidicoccus mucosus TaxID=1184151 RepID=A0A178INY3_9BACT|nr:ABC transporter substrate-binding protein [Opitutaceae bacterium TSB47]